MKSHTPIDIRTAAAGAGFCAGFLVGVVFALIMQGA